MKAIYIIIFVCFLGSCQSKKDRDIQWEKETQHWLDTNSGMQESKKNKIKYQRSLDSINRVLYEMKHGPMKSVEIVGKKK